MIHAAYSDLKLAWHQDRMNDMRDGKRPKPIELQFVISDLCNHDCHWCAYRASNGLSSSNFGEKQADGTVEKNPKRMIPFHKAREILDDGIEIGARSVIFTGGGEPTVHPQHMELFSHALELGYDCALNTNGQVLRRGWEAVLPRFTYVRFSVDAANSEEYAKARRVAHSIYGRVLDNITSVVKASPKTTVGAGYVVTPDNYVNLLEGVSRLRDTGVSYVRLAAMQSTEGAKVYGEKWDSAKWTARDVAFRLSCDGFSVVNLVDDSLFGVAPDYKKCGFQYVTIYIGADLNIYRCCYTAYSDLGTVGSIKDRRFAEWFRSDEASKSYDGFDARACSWCPLDGKNRVIQYMTDPAPVHVNFV